MRRVAIYIYGILSFCRLKTRSTRKKCATRAEVLSKMTVTILRVSVEIICLCYIWRDYFVHCEYIYNSRIHTYIYTQLRQREAGNGSSSCIYLYIYASSSYILVSRDKFNVVLYTYFHHYTCMSIISSMEGRVVAHTLCIYIRIYEGMVYIPICNI